VTDAHAPPHISYHADFWSFNVKCFGHTYMSKFGCTEATPPWDVAVANHKKQSPYQCWNAEFDRNKSNRIWAWWGPKISAPLEFRSLGRRSWLTHLGIHHDRHYAEEFGRSTSNGTSVQTENWQGNWAPRVPPFEVTHGHRNWHGSIGYGTYEFY